MARRRFSSIVLVLDSGVPEPGKIEDDDEDEHDEDESRLAP